MSTRKFFKDYKFRVGPVGLAFGKFIRAHLFQIALEIMWLLVLTKINYIKKKN